MNYKELGIGDSPEFFVLILKTYYDIIIQRTIRYMFLIGLDIRHIFLNPL